MPSRDPTSRARAKSNNNRKSGTGSPVVVIVGAVGRKNSDGNKRKISSRTSDGEKSLIKCIVKVLKPVKSEEKLPSEQNSGSDNEDLKNRSPLICKQPNMLSRTNLKQQLMREHTQQLEKKERELSSSAPTLSTSAIKVPLYSSPTPLQVPKHVLMVKSKLENPTPYHMKQSQQRQVHEYLSQSHHSGRSVPLPMSNVSSSDPSPNNLSSAVSDPTSPEELEEFWQDFRNLHAVTNSVADSGVDPSLTASATEAGILEVLSMLPGVNNVSSSSCPAQLTDVSEEVEVELLSDEKLQAFQKDRQKKDNHNRIERRRRFNINDRIKELGTLLPGSNDPYYELVKDIRQNKGNILKAAVDYVRCLKNEVKKIPKLEHRCHVTEQLNRKLLLRIQALELELKSHNIPVSQSTWYPSSESDLNAIIKQEPSYSSVYTCAASSDQSGVTPFSFTAAASAKLLEKQQQANLQTVRSAPCQGTRTGYPIMQFLTVKQDPASQATPPTSSTPSPRPCCSSPTVFPQFDDLMMDDDQPVTGDPMLSSRDSFSPDNMDFAP